MANEFFDHPILNSPYEYPSRHWELDEVGQPTQKIIDRRRTAKFITPIPKPKKRKVAGQKGFVFDEGKGLSTEQQEYDPNSIVNEVRQSVDAWRSLPNPNQWQPAPCKQEFKARLSGLRAWLADQRPSAGPSTQRSRQLLRQPRAGARRPA